MSAMDLLAGTSDSENKPYFGFSQLPHGYHKIVKFRWVKNKMYKMDSEKPGLKRTVLIELADQVLFLPEYIARKFNDDDEKIAELNSGITIFLYFGGRREENRWVYAIIKMMYILALLFK